MIYLCYAIMIVVPYLLCGINSAIIVTKIKTGEDIRTLGSGNAGPLREFIISMKEALAHPEKAQLYSERMGTHDSAYYGEERFKKIESLFEEE